MEKLLAKILVTPFLPRRFLLRASGVRWVFSKQAQEKILTKH